MGLWSPSRPPSPSKGEASSPPPLASCVPPPAAGSATPADGSMLPPSDSHRPPLDPRRRMEKRLLQPPEEGGAPRRCRIRRARAPPAPHHRRVISVTPSPYLQTVILPALSWPCATAVERGGLLLHHVGSAAEGGGALTEEAGEGAAIVEEAGERASLAEDARSKEKRARVPLKP